MAVRTESIHALTRSEAAVRLVREHSWRFIQVFEPSQAACAFVSGCPHFPILQRTSLDLLAYYVTLQSNARGKPGTSALSAAAQWPIQ